MISFNRSLAAIAFCLFCVLASMAQNQWLGVYEFSEDGGKNAGGSPIFISHKLEIMNSDDGLIATIESNGYQTSRDLLCSVKVKGDKAYVYFLGYGDNNMFESYTKGQLMLTLESKGGKDQVLTHWGAFQPIVPKNEKNGKVYFTKTK
jgi:hypothetical protein